MWRPTVKRLVLVLALLVYCNPASAKTIIGVITQSNVTVRSSADAGSAPIGTINQGEFVALTDAVSGWFRVMWQNKSTKKMESGWVPTSAVKLVSGGGGTGDTYETSGGAKFELTVDNSELDCTEGYSGGFSDCTISLRVSYDSDYNGDNTPNVVVSCDAELETKNGDGWTGSESESGRKDFYGKSDGGTIEIDFDFLSMSPTVNVEIDEVTCRISDVY